ncbi:MAG TPA: DNA repair protein RecO [Terriglobia bacterium]|nr:DNA repair protein RecO [Terriglobia bacterium]
MPLRETEAIVLRTYRLGEADKIVSFFTRQFGRLRAVATGAQRPKSRYGGSLEPLSYVRLWVFERENRDLLRLNSAELLESFYDMQKDYRVQVAVQYLVEVSERILPEREVNERAFRLLLAVGRALKRSGEVDRPLLYFNYWLLRLAGFLPDLEHCAACGKALGDRPGYYGRGSEGLVCADCRTSLTGPTGRTGLARQTVSPAALGLAPGMRRSPLEQWLSGETPSAGVRELRLFLEEVLEAHAERKFVTRELLNEE